MTSRRSNFVFAAIVALTTFATGARADDCPPLRMVASVQMSYDGAGRPYIPVTLGTANKLMLVDTGGAFSMVNQQTADTLHFSRVRVPLQQFDVSGNHSDQAAEVSPFGIGNLKADHTELMIDPDKSSTDPDVGGVIGPSILRNYDADFDFGANKFNLLLQDHCPGRVVYWPSTSVAAVPIHVAKAVGHIIVPVTLDGKKYNAALDTGASHTLMTTRIAESDFGLKLNTPDAQEVGIVEGGNVRIYRHTFHSLALEGISIGNPVVHIIPDVNRDALSRPPPIGTRFSNSDEAASMEDVTVGIDVLRHLHLYIAYKEQMLYITPAETPVAQATGGGATPSAGGSAVSAAPH